MNVKRFVRHSLNGLGYDIRRIRARHTRGENGNSCPPPAPYVERAEYGPSNIQTKLESLRNGAAFESPDIVNLNHAAASLVRDEKRIVELGAGTGTFAYLAATAPDRLVCASEFDKETHDWAATNRSRPNIVYVCGPVPASLGTFDVAVAVELIEHVFDFPALIREMIRLAPRAIITTPNRAQSSQRFTAGPPEYFKHVREWTGGEFYWVLRSFFSDVKLYGVSSCSEPILVPVDVNTTNPYLIADCTAAIR